MLCFLCCFYVSYCFQKKKKLDRRVGGWGLTNSSFSRIFGIILTWQDPLANRQSIVCQPMAYICYYQ